MQRIPENSQLDMHDYLRKQNPLLFSSALITFSKRLHNTEAIELSFLVI